MTTQRMWFWLGHLLLSAQLFVFASCSFLSPSTRDKRDSDNVAVDLKQQLQAALDVNAQLRSEIIGLQVKLQNTVQTNTGAFSGGAAYLTVVVVVFMALTFVLGLMYLRKNKWRVAFEELSGAVEDNVSTTAAKKSFSIRAERKHVRQLVEKNLKQRGITKSPKHK